MAKPSSALSKKSSSASRTSAKKMLGDLPPSSSVTGIRFSDAYCMIEPAGGGLAGEGDLRHPRARGQRLAGFDPEALHHVDHAARQDVGDQLHQRHDRHRRLLGRLEHDAVPGRERGRQLPGRHQEREVPGDDLRHDAERLVEVVGDGVVVELGEPALLGPDAAREVAEVVDSQRQVRVRGLADRLPVVDRLDEGEGVEVGFDPVGDAVEDVGPVRRRGGVPAEGRGVGRVERPVYVLVGGAGDLAQRLAVIGVGLTKYWPRAGGTYSPAIQLS